ncbi:DNA-directed RNA polymerase III subunit C82 ASCRUDRAFT_31291 [Ascoidea rubescens DSM 1968]|uniref:DNA-directed RNA polymerase III subunit RPC3 n=1 Tax=Ascoidea rubescens DSM 1968 TaxID=1344418 RepID=A0A1D2VN78_9ASCO|nr:hypothetical protein ASCRUDRAFT_31291 [Ascoidea rubescens DSM 1968]ODV63060.1 hypothetical protein ASCRUDRAFT_31291 [Ascoidea rubescens DSM 1968]
MTTSASILPTLSPQASLFTTLVKNSLGSNASIIISILYSYGKSTINFLISKSKLNKKLVKSILVSLIQLSITTYWTDESSKQTYYFLNQEGLLVLLYSGDIITHIKNYYQDDLPAEIIQNILNYGNLTLDNYLQTNMKNREKSSLIEFYFNKLIFDGFLMPINSNYFKNKFELYDQIYKKKLVTVFTNKSTLSIAKQKIQILKETDFEFESYFLIDNSSIFLENDRFMMRNNDYNKKIHKRINGNTSFKFNLKRYLKTVRSTHLIKLVNQYLGELPSKIYEKILFKVEKNSPNCFNYEFNNYLNDIEFLSNNSKIDVTNDGSKLMENYLNYVRQEYEDNSKNYFNFNDILNLVKSDNLDLSDSINLNFKKKKRQTSKIGKNDAKASSKRKINTKNDGEDDGYNDYEEDDDDDDFDDDFDDIEVDGKQSQSGLLNQHLKILANHSIPFLVEKTSGKYYIPFSKLIPILKEKIYLYVIKSSVDLNCFKILNCIICERLVEDKRLMNLTLIDEKTLRICINKLFKLQAICIQEIPKTAHREASREVFAYRFNNKNCYEILGNNFIYESYLIFQNLEKMREKNSILLSKVNRDDVKGQEEELLLANELNQLKWLKERELNCVGRINRARSLWDVFSII